jgi:hypothetical protein
MRTKQIKASKKKENNSDSLVDIYQFYYGGQKKRFWFMTIKKRFSDSFWDTFISAVNDMRFCARMGGKKEAYIRCSLKEPGAVFTTASHHVYHVLPMTDIEDRIMSLAKFIMSFQKALDEYIMGTDFQVTWDCNLLHHVDAPITKAVYKSHSGYS